MEERPVTAVLLAAGSGRRMEMDVNKVLLPLEPKGPPMVFYPLAALDRNRRIGEILLVAREEERDTFRRLLHRQPFRTPIRILAGGKERCDSVRNALEAAEGEIVLIHDGARPFLRQRYVEDCVAAMANCPGAIVAVRTEERIREVDRKGYVSWAFFPDHLYQVQTPQCFHKDVLLDCHDRITDKSGITDDSALLRQCGYAVRVLPGGRSNLKITYGLDRAVAQALLREDRAIEELRLIDDGKGGWING